MSRKRGEVHEVALCVEVEMCAEVELCGEVDLCAEVERCADNDDNENYLCRIVKEKYTIRE